MDKWYAIALAVFIVCLFGGLALEGYQKSQCRVEAVKAGKSAEDIVKICK